MELKRRILMPVRRSVRLLIVPYGIETLKIIIDVFHTLTFNRTLWN